MFSERDKKREKQLDFLNDEYKACLKSQSNIARMFQGGNAGTSFASISDRINNRKAYTEKEKECEGYKQLRDALYAEVYSKPKV